jgi:hypothetical protein
MSKPNQDLGFLSKRSKKQRNNSHHKKVKETRREKKPFGVCISLIFSSYPHTLTRPNEKEVDRNSNCLAL